MLSCLFVLPDSCISLCHHFSVLVMASSAEIVYLWPNHELDILVSLKKKISCMIAPEADVKADEMDILKKNK